jgi:hypothetical protein
MAWLVQAVAVQLLDKAIMAETSPLILFPMSPAVAAAVLEQQA